MSPFRWSVTAIAAVVIAAVLAVPPLLGGAGMWGEDKSGVACSSATAAASPGAAAPSGTAAPAPVALRSVAQWDALFEQSWRRERAASQALSRSTDSWDHYTLAYSVDALTAAYLATGRREYLEEALSLTENVVASAVPSKSIPGSQYHDGYLGWASAQESGQEVPLFESYFWRYATRLLRVVRQSPVLFEDAALQSRYERLLAFAERNVVEKWYVRGADENIFRSRTHMAAHWAYIALNLSEITTDPVRRDRYRAIVTAVDDDLPNYRSSLHGQLMVNPQEGGAYFWSDVWGSCGTPGQDVAHGNGVIAYVVEAHDLRVDWSDADITGFVQALAKVIWPRPGPGAEFVDGSGSGTGWLSDGFVKLGRYDPTLQRRLESHQPANAQFYANGALNAAILLCPHSVSASGTTQSADTATGSMAAAAPVCA